MKIISFFMVLLINLPYCSISAMSVVPAHYPDNSRYQLKQKSESLEVHSEKENLIEQKKSGYCIPLTMCGGFFVLIVGFGIIFPIVYYSQPHTILNATL